VTVHAVAAAPETAAYGVGAYLAVFVLMALSFAGIPAIGAAVVGWAAVLASQGKLNIVAVLIVAALGAEAGGLAGYAIGERWGRKLLDRPGLWQERRKQAVAKAEAVYAKWGRLAVFFTSTMVSGVLRMKYSQFVVWNFIVGAAYVLSVGPAAYGAGKVSADEQDAGSLAVLAAGLAIAAGCVTLAARYYRRRRARRSLAGVRASEVSQEESR
jgi:membrane protein DedA with SNARE-associated domain